MIIQLFQRISSLRKYLTIIKRLVKFCIVFCLLLAGILFFLLLFNEFPALTPFAIQSLLTGCDFIIPKEISSLAYTGAHQLCWQSKYRRLNYMIDNFDSSPIGYVPGTLKGASQGVHVYVEFSPGPPNTRYSYLYKNINISGYSVMYQTYGDIHQMRYQDYILDSDNLRIVVGTSEWGMGLKTNPIKLINYTIHELSLFNEIKFPKYQTPASNADELNLQPKCPSLCFQRKLQWLGKITRKGAIVTCECNPIPPDKHITCITRDVKGDPISNNAVAKNICLHTCDTEHGEWNGQWGGEFCGCNICKLE